jgi:hypothetical protein
MKCLCVMMWLEDFVNSVSVVSLQLCSFTLINEMLIITAIACWFLKYNSANLPIPAAVVQ